jgi:hypothetical protein
MLLLVEERKHEIRPSASLPDWEWRKDALPTNNFTLHGITAFVLSPFQLLEEKLVYEQGTGRKPRPKDIYSMKIIQRITDSI